LGRGGETERVVGRSRVVREGKLNGKPVCEKNSLVILWKNSKEGDGAKTKKTGFGRRVRKVRGKRRSGSLKERRTCGKRPRSKFGPRRPSVSLILKKQVSDSLHNSLKTPTSVTCQTRMSWGPKSKELSKTRKKSLPGRSGKSGVTRTWGGEITRDRWRDEKLG